MKMIFLTSMPPVSVRTWFRTRSSTLLVLPEELPRAFAMEYNSSKNAMQSAAARALSNEIRKDMSVTDLL